MSYHLFSETTPKARKQHACIWCGGKINIGDTYLYERSVYDGHMQNHKWHPECHATAAQDFKESGEAEFTPWSNDRPITP